MQASEHSIKDERQYDTKNRWTGKMHSPAGDCIPSSPSPCRLPIWMGARQIEGLHSM